MRLQLRQRTLLIVLSCSVISLVMFGLFTFYGFWHMQQSILKESDAIGSQASQLAQDALQEQLEDSLQRTVDGNADKIDLQMQALHDYTQILAREMTRISSQPELYPDRPARDAARQHSDGTTVYLTYSSRAPIDGSEEAMRREIRRTANISDLLLQIQTASPVISSVYVASRRGFMLQADPLEDGAFASEDQHASPFEMTERPWYQQAQAADSVIFTKVEKDFYSGNSLITCAAPYSDQSGFVGVVGLDCVLKESEQVVLDARSNEQDISFVVNHDGQILFSTENTGELSVPHSPTGDALTDLRQSDNPATADLITAITQGQSGCRKTELAGQSYLAAYAPLQNVPWSFVTLIHTDKLQAPIRDNQQRINEQTQSHLTVQQEGMWQVIILLALIGALLTALVCWAGVRLSDRLVTPIKKLNQEVRNFAQHNMQGQIEVIRSGDEIESLSLSFNALAGQLQDYIAEATRNAAENERIATELQVAANIQQSLLPNDFLTDRQDFSIYASMTPAKEVGGDFYDFYLIDDKHLILTIADVSGKGVPAAMFMVVARTILRNFTLTMQHADELSSVIRCVNNQLAAGNDAMMFVTVFYGMLDLTTGHFTYVNAGHNAPLVYHQATGAYTCLTGRHGCMLGAMEDVDFPQQELDLAHGDSLFLYTDGVTEAMDPSGQVYSTQALLDCLNKTSPQASLPDIQQAVSQSLDDHTKGAAQSDDITMLTVRFS